MKKFNLPKIVVLKGKAQCCDEFSVQSIKIESYSVIIKPTERGVYK